MTFEWVTDLARETHWGWTAADTSRKPGTETNRGDTTMKTTVPCFRALPATATATLPVAATGNGLRTRSGLRSGGGGDNHGLRVRSAVRAGGGGDNHGLRVRSAVRSGGGGKNHGLRVRSAVRG